jgi:Protein of unknown function (DUF2924)
MHQTTGKSAGWRPIQEEESGKPHRLSLGRMNRSRKSPGLAEEIARLGDLTREQLIQRWIQNHRHPPPKGISRRLLELSAAYALQAKVFGGLKPHLRKALAAALDPHSEPSRVRRKAAPLKAGSQLVRVWNGRSHYVEVVDGGFVWNDQKFRSLTAIAYKITGARWSGPRFFGL